MSTKDDDYEVGRGKPPAEFRFMKGQSGNPGGRPKRERSKLDPGKILQSIDNEELIVVFDGKSQRMLKAGRLFSADIQQGDQRKPARCEANREDGRSIFQSRRS